MDNKEKMFEKMAAMMKNCCTGEGGMADCCSMMKKMMQFCEGGELKKKKETKEDTSAK